jgi:hypothetical protein
VVGTAAVVVGVVAEVVVVAATGAAVATGWVTCCAMGAKDELKKPPNIPGICGGV